MKFVFRSLFLLSAIALFSLGCERRDFAETQRLHKSHAHHDDAHDHADHADHADADHDSKNDDHAPKPAAKKKG